MVLWSVKRLSGKPCALHDRITTCSESELCTFYEVFVSTSSNKSPAPKKLPKKKAEKNTYASKPFDLLEIEIIMLR